VRLEGVKRKKGRSLQIGEGNKKTAFAARFGNGEEAMFLLVVLDADRLLDQPLSGEILAYTVQACVTWRSASMSSSLSLNTRRIHGDEYHHSTSK
jgi:hypothetical protein